MTMKQIIESVRKVYPYANAHKYTWDRYCIYNGITRVEGWGCLTERNAWLSCLNQLNKRGKTNLN